MGKLGKTNGFFCSVCTAGFRHRLVFGCVFQRSFRRDNLFCCGKLLSLLRGKVFV